MKKFLIALTAAMVVSISGCRLVSPNDTDSVPLANKPQTHDMPKVEEGETASVDSSAKTPSDKDERLAAMQQELARMRASLEALKTGQPAPASPAQDDDPNTPSLEGAEELARNDNSPDETELVTQRRERARYADVCIMGPGDRVYVDWVKKSSRAANVIGEDNRVNEEEGVILVSFSNDRNEILFGERNTKFGAGQDDLNGTAELDSEGFTRSTVYAPDRWRDKDGSQHRTVTVQSGGREWRVHVIRIPKALFGAVDRLEGGYNELSFWFRMVEGSTSSCFTLGPNNLVHVARTDADDTLSADVTILDYSHGSYWFQHQRRPADDVNNFATSQLAIHQIFQKAPKPPEPPVEE